VLANPALLQPVIERYSQTQFVLLHASYPYTREAGYLASVYGNVFCKFRFEETKESDSQIRQWTLARSGQSLRQTRNAQQFAMHLTYALRTKSCFRPMPTTGLMGTT